MEHYSVTQVGVRSLIAVIEILAELGRLAKADDFLGEQTGAPDQLSETSSQVSESSDQEKQQ